MTAVIPPCTHALNCTIFPSVAIIVFVHRCKWRGAVIWQWISSISGIRTYSKFVLCRLVFDTEISIFGEGPCFVPVGQILTKNYINGLRQPTNVVVTEPELFVEISKTVFIGVPVTEEINTAVQSPLKYRPSTAVSEHVTEDWERIISIWIYHLHTASAHARWIQSGTITC